jgi:GT2 family glycosyltransferase
MFVDGDSALDPAFPEAAAAFLDTRPDAAVVCGVVRERDRDKNVFHRLCEIEWQAAAGEALFCGGIAMMRAEAFRDAGGFRTDLLGGEEPELCLRLRERGHKIWRIEAPMAVHDADIAGVGRWLSRMRRGGRAFAEIASLHRHSPTRIWRREAARAVFWAAIAPAALIGGLALHPWAFAALAAYPAQIIRMATLGRGRLPPAAQDFAWPYAFFMTLAKFPEALGVLDFILSSARRSRDDRRPPGAPESC